MKGREFGLYKERWGNIFKMCRHQNYAQIEWIPYALQDKFWTPILDASKEIITQESKMQKPVNFMSVDSKPILNAPIKAATQEFTIQESEIQVSVIQ